MATATATADALVRVSSDLWFAFLDLIPGLVGATVLLAVGYVVGRALGRVAYEILTRLGVDKELRKEAHIKADVSHILDLVVRWVIYLVFIQASADVLGIAAVSRFVDKVIAFLPEAVSAGIILLTAYAVGVYFKEELMATETIYAAITGKAIFFLVLYLGLSVALRLINIPLLIIDQILLILVGAVGLGLAIALGLGLKDVVAEIGEEAADEYT